MNCDALKASLTPGQQVRLQPLSEIGSGSTACVYATPKVDTVLKLTTDPDDAYALDKVRGSRSVPRIDKIFQLQTHDGRPRDLWAIEVERVQPIAYGSPAWKFLDVFNNAVNWDETHLTVTGPNGKYKVPTKTKTRAKKECVEGADTGYFPADQVPMCQQTAKDAFEVYEELGRRGVAFADSHPGNWGMKDGRLVAIDLGLSNTPPTQLPLLAGWRRKRKPMLGQNDRPQDDGFGFMLGLAVMIGALVVFVKTQTTVEKK